MPHTFNARWVIGHHKLRAIARIGRASVAAELSPLALTAVHHCVPVTTAHACYRASVATTPTPWAVFIMSSNRRCTAVRRPPCLALTVRASSPATGALLVAGIAWVTVALGSPAPRVRDDGWDPRRVHVPGRRRRRTWPSARLELRAGVWALFGGALRLRFRVLRQPDDYLRRVGHLLGFLFLIVGVWRMVRAFVERCQPALVDGTWSWDPDLAFWTSSASSSSTRDTCSWSSPGSGRCSRASRPSCVRSSFAPDEL